MKANGAGKLPTGWGVGVAAMSGGPGSGDCGSPAEPRCVASEILWIAICQRCEGWLRGGRKRVLRSINRLTVFAMDYRKIT
jgi:hypothetical protein